MRMSKTRLGEPPDIVELLEERVKKSVILGCKAVKKMNN